MSHSVYLGCSPLLIFRIKICHRNLSGSLNQTNNETQYGVILTLTWWCRIFNTLSWWYVENCSRLCNVTVLDISMSLLPTIQIFTAFRCRKHPMSVYTFTCKKIVNALIHYFKFSAICWTLLDSFIDSVTHCSQKAELPVCQNLQ